MCSGLLKQFVRQQLRSLTCRAALAIAVESVGSGSGDERPRLERNRPGWRVISRTSHCKRGQSLSFPLKRHHKEAVHIVTMWPGAQRAAFRLQITERLEG